MARPPFRRFLRPAQRNSGLTLVETVLSLGLLAMTLTTILLLILSVTRQERAGSDAVDAQELLIAVASDLRLSLERSGAATDATTRSSHFGIAPLPRAEYLRETETVRAYIRADWASATSPAEARPGLPVYELRIRPQRVPEAGSLESVRVVLELWRTSPNPEAEPPAGPLAVLPQNFAAP